MSKRIFISYSHKDREFASHIAAELECRGAEVFIDYEGLAGGDNFIATIGVEIEKSDVVVLIFSPRSEQSKWVQAEVAWAFQNDKLIIPAWLESAPMRNFFFLINRDYVDFTQWIVDKNITEPITKLVRSVKLPKDCLTTKMVKEPQMNDTSHHPPESEDRVVDLPIFDQTNLDLLFQKAAEITDDDPEQAVYLYRQVLESDPNFMGGKIRKFVLSEEKKLNPERIRRLLKQARMARTTGSWGNAISIADDILTIDTNHKEAQTIKSVSQRNINCDPVYHQVKKMADNGSLKGAVRLLLDIKENCPNYDDPAGILEKETISRITSRLVKETHTFRVHGNLVWSVSFSPDGKWLASTGNDGRICIWDMESLEEDPKILSKPNVRFYRSLFSPNSKTLITSSVDGNIEQWSIKTGKAVQLMKNEKISRDLSFSLDGSLLIIANDDHSVTIWDTENWRQLSRSYDYPSAVSSATVSPDNKLLVSFAGDSIYAWNLNDSSKELFSVVSSFVRKLIFNSDGSILVAALDNGRIQLWDVKSKQEIAIFEGHKKRVSNIDFSPDNQTLVSSSEDSSIILWDIEIGKQLQVLKRKRHDPQNKPIECVVFSPNGRLLASGGQDAIVRLWGLV